MAAPREMLVEEGVVIGVEPLRASVRLTVGEHCEGCPASHLCRPDRDDRRVLDVADPLGVSVGDRVRVAVPGDAVLKASLLVYGLPLVLLLVGVLVGLRIWPEGDGLRELWSFLLGAGLAAAAVPVAIRLSKNGRGAEAWANDIHIVGTTGSA